jgi:hypothetical protein
MMAIPPDNSATSAAAPDRNSALGILTSAISHDLRAPVGQIQLYAELLAEIHGDAIPPACADGLHTIAREAAQITAMTDAILSLARLSVRPPVPEMVDLVAIADAVVHDCRTRWPEPVTFIAPPALTVFMDPLLVRAALQQLLDNAWKFSQRRSSAVVELGRSADGPDGAATFFVRDNGHGFDDSSAAAKRLFAPFKRMPVADEYPGIGIGLAMVARIVDDHGGSYRVASQPETGTTVTIWPGPL